MKFANIIYLHIAPIILVLIIVILIHSYKRYKYFLVSFLDPVLFEKNLHKDILKINIIVNILVLIIAIFFLISLSGPQWGLVPREIKSRTADIIIGIDVSKSMLAEDVLPNRLEFAKKAIRLLLDKIESSRVGIITFAGISFYQCPLTIDISAVKYFVNFIDTESVPFPGTKIGDCLSEALRVLKQYGGSTKILVLFSDGEDHGSTVEHYVEELRKNGVVVYTVGIGTPEGRPIPIRDERGIIVDYKKDKKGNIVTTKLNEKLLSSIAEKTFGKYYALSDNNLFIVENLARELNSVKKDKLKNRVFNLYKSRYHYFVYVLIILFLIEIFMPKVWLAKIF